MRVSDLARSVAFDRDHLGGRIRSPVSAICGGVHARERTEVRLKPDATTDWRLTIGLPVRGFAKGWNVKFCGLAA
jgi:hypothetical protein